MFTNKYVSVFVPLQVLQIIFNFLFYNFVFTQVPLDVGLQKTIQYFRNELNATKKMFLPDAGHFNPGSAD